MPACLRAGDQACCASTSAPSPAAVGAKRRRGFGAAGWLAGGPRRWMMEVFLGSPSLSLSVCAGQPGPTNCTVPDYPPACLVVHEAAETRRGPAIVARAREGLKTRAQRSRSQSRSQVKERRSFHKLLGQSQAHGRSDKQPKQRPATHDAGQQHAAGAMLGPCWSHAGPAPAVRCPLSVTSCSGARG